jgi:hypothetical protein
MTGRSSSVAVFVAVGMQLLGAALSARAAAKNCQTAADCGGAPATCELTTYQTCAGKDPTCPAGSSCGDKPTSDDQTHCAPYVEGICRQPHELPCRIDTDCGVGFRCAEQIGRACSGMGTSGGNGVPPSFHEECHETRGTFACELIATRCATDGDCASGLRCLPSRSSSCGATTASPGAANPPDTTPVAACEQAPTVCAPEGYFGVVDVSPEQGKDATADGRADTAGNLVDEPSLDPVEESNEADDDERDARGGDGGCSLVPGSNAGAVELSWLALAGVLVLQRRRRPNA